MRLAVALFALMATQSHATENQLECMALNIYHEARGEEPLGQVAVAQVVMNRVQHNWFPDTICDVVYQGSQFSWTHMRRDRFPHDTEAYMLAVAIANAVIEGEFQHDLTGGATFYHTTEVNPGWNAQMQMTDVIGIHEFYYWDGTWN